MDNEDKWCFAWFEQKEDGQNRAAMAKAAQWSSGNTITVSFLDGDPAVQQKVRDVAQRWTVPGMANLTLRFQQDTNSLIRISFKFAGSWSVIGTTCKQITDKKQPTMNFGWLTPTTPDDEVQRVVLHEFGHALGLIHEHQNPAGGIQWNKEQVIKDLSGPPNNWPLAVIEHNMFEPQSKEETNFTKLDPKSIMMYPIPKRWTTNGFSVGLNTTLSATDKKFTHQQYP
jgi:serralysin